uniref:Uncharacterized protein n=2 Tax=Candidatus Kentrum sp. LPFa TaxID=2126335 RepID=A0A450XJA9_9GAMM|nr:MAG: hypothetical protein BECKLPF1236A_GA0070988_103405 [Candidatus Kentron sp. LPFa]VFK29403.1 MAG: hypothetical protein BECKLPF1236A_GA0070988_107311 [Candidatus Kentron sp. LPFa]
MRVAIHPTAPNWLLFHSKVTLPGPFNTVCYQTALATYPFRVRAMPSVQGRTRTGTLWFLSEPHGFRLSAESPRLTLLSETAALPV